MRHDEGIRRLVDEIEYLRAKRALAASARPRLVVVHGEHLSTTKCLPGETIEQIGLAVHSKMISMSLSRTGLVVADILARKRPMLLTAAQIERILFSDSFYLRLGANTSAVTRLPVRLTRKSIKVYIQRLRQQLGKALAEAGLAMRPEDILVSESTDLRNVMTYRFAIPCEFIHAASSGRHR